MLYSSSLMLNTPVSVFCELLSSLKSWPMRQVIFYPCFVFMFHRTFILLLGVSGTQDVFIYCLHCYSAHRRIFTFDTLAHVNKTPLSRACAQSRQLLRKFLQCRVRSTLLEKFPRFSFSVKNAVGMQQTDIKGLRHGWRIKWYSWWLGPFSILFAWQVTGKYMYGICSMYTVQIVRWGLDL